MAKRVMARLEGLSGRLGSVPSATYAIAYFMLIALFAALYASMPECFYNTTARFERSAIQRQLELEGELREAAATRIKETCGSSLGRSAQWTLCSSAPTVQFMEFQGGMARVRFTIAAQDVRLAYYRQAHVSVDCLLYGRVGGFNPGADVEVIPIAIMNRESDLSAAEVDTLMCALFRLEPNTYAVVSAFGTGVTDSLVIDKPGNRDLSNRFAIAVRSGFAERLRGYERVWRGIADGIGGGAQRMIYLSVVTQTTLGFGDIVPVSNTARALVSTQSVLGVLLVGLFLNSLATRGQSTNARG